MTASARLRPRPARLLAALALAAAVATVIAFFVLEARDEGGRRAAPGLPRTSDYHSLLVSPQDARELVLGTHQGLYRSRDGGRTWAAAELGGQDAMSLARASQRVLWAAGHDVLARSIDGGASWDDVRPEGLPGLDVHGFTVDPRRSSTLYAAIAGQGLYRSTDGGRSFALASGQVGPAVMALAVTADGRILAGDMQRGLVESRDGGRSWRAVLLVQLAGLAVDPSDPSRVLAAGAGVHLSTDGGRTWRQVLEAPEGAGPVAWAPTEPGTAYVVGFDRTLSVTRDGGESWRELER